MDSLFEHLAAELEITVDYLLEEFMIDEEINVSELLSTYCAAWRTVHDSPHWVQNRVLLKSGQEDHI